LAWLDDRVWCKPKFTDLSDRAFRVWVSGVCYSAGFARKGYLTAGQQKTVGADAKVRRELVAAQCWEERDDGVVYIHDWDEHNAKRDRAREKDRERKRLSRAMSNGTSVGLS
jgi:hypothetical protein